MGKDFALTFNQKYPQLNKEAIEELVLHIDEVLVRYFGCPLNMAITVGSAVMECRGHCGYMIYDVAQKIDSPA